MYDEYGYQRTGKKCREKFENLYKYYKKTKGGKSGRQDGKHYRFFRQLEALYGDQSSNNNNNNNSSTSVSNQTHFANFTYDYSKSVNPFTNICNNNNNQESFASLVSFSNSSDFDTIVTSEDESAELDLLEIHAKNNPNNKKKKFKENSFKAEIKDSIDFQMKKIVEKQEAWMEKMTRTIDRNEKERISREEQWRKQDAERVEREQRMWAGEKAWILARDTALIEAFGKLAGKESRVSRQEEEIMVESQNEGLKVDWDGHVSSWDWSGDCFSKCGKKRMGPVVEGQGYERGVNSSRDEFSYFSGRNARLDILALCSQIVLTPQSSFPITGVFRFANGFVWHDLLEDDSSSWRMATTPSSKVRSSRPHTSSNSFQLQSTWCPTRWRMMRSEQVSSKQKNTASSKPHESATNVQPMVQANLPTLAPMSYSQELFIPSFVPNWGTNVLATYEGDKTSKSSMVNQHPYLD
ncbi:duplicated homeodomain-like superfamily protein [Striga asiatica]|uniref:Duplicated homeodomain-like superfamily protein n=1 Tax=Striga asiatica TaxID=4170 RepID=A0A5A7QDV4_STRAF|nr:duplicated homeodomain-like superfamily protein [Striga asiatica]